MSHIVVCSQDKLFTEALATVFTSELAVTVTHVEHPENLASLSPDLVIANELLTGFWSGPSLVYSPGTPRKIHTILSDVRARLAIKNEPLLLSEYIMLDNASRKLLHNDTGSARELTEKERALLLYIKEHGDTSREDILTAVWGMAPDVDTHTLETHLYRLRQKWRELADFDCILATDKGYRWYE